MKLVKLLAAACAISAAGTTVATAFCPALSDQDQLPSKFAKRGPFHVDPASGWIVGEDQLKQDFEVSGEASALLRAIRSEFEERGIKLAVLAAPPRPLFAPQGALPPSYDHGKSLLAFSDYISALNEVGIPAPDLSQLATTEAGGSYYFKRDTHWTPQGAYVSALQLADVLGHSTATLPPVSFDQNYDEKGSLSMVVEQTCGMRPDPEIVSTPDYAKTNDQGSLLGTRAAAGIALVGTSFSDRYKTDSYQVAGAISHALGQDVENFSTTGGGMVGAMAAFVQSGALERGQFNAVVWETPYTNPLTNVSGLRQVLGALQGGDQLTEIHAGRIGTSWKTFKSKSPFAPGAGLQITTPGVDTGKLRIELYDKSGNKVRIKLVKPDRVDPGLRSEIWQISLMALPLAEIARIKVKLDETVENARITLTN